MLNTRLSAAVLVTFGEQGGRFEPPFPSLVSLDRFAPTLGGELRRELVPRDGWGLPLKALLIDPETFLLISFGADGVADTDYVKVWSLGGGFDDDASIDSFSQDRDFVYFNGEFIRRPHAPESADKRALSDVRAIGTAIESFAVDNETYPGPTSGLQPIDAVAGQLEPIYIRTLPRVDPWGQPYRVCSDGEAYVIVSSGLNRTLEADYEVASGLVSEIAAPRARTVQADDIVFVDGQFARWPAGVDPDNP
jgi:hypothetical protein